MKIIDNLIQGSTAWHEHRRNHHNASEGSAMMGCSPYKTRDQLLAEKVTGIIPEVDAATQARFDRGHQIEIKARSIAEAILGEDLFPVVGVSDDGYLSASFDGLTMLGDIGFECKSWNEQKAADIGARRLPEADRWQVVQQLSVDGPRAILYAVTDGTKDKWAALLVCWSAADVPTAILQKTGGALELDSHLADDLRAGWAQFDKDLSAWQPPAHEAPAPIGTAPESLPALHIELSGAVTASNLPQFKEQALAVIRGINTDLQTDGDFADAELAIKFCKDAEDRLAAAKDYALSQTLSIDELFRTLDDISAEARRVRLDLSKLVKSEKDKRKRAIVVAANDAMHAHIAGLNKSLGGAYMPAIPANFPGVIKGKSSLASIQSAVNDELARAKIEANQRAEEIRVNLKLLEEHMGHAGLFPDRTQLVLKQTEDLRATITARIAEHDTRERERKEAEAKAQAEREATARAQEEIERVRAEERAKAEAEAKASRATQAKASADCDGDPTVSLGDIANRLGFRLTQEFISELGIEPAGRDKRAVLYTEKQVDRLYDELIYHVQAVRDGALEVAA